MTNRNDGVDDLRVAAATTLRLPTRHTAREQQLENRRRAKARANLREFAKGRPDEPDWFRELVNALGLTLNRDHPGVGR